MTPEQEKFERFKFFTELYKNTFKALNDFDRLYKECEYNVFYLHENIRRLESHNEIESKLKEFRSTVYHLVDSFEMYISLLQDTCILKLDGHMSDNEFLKFKNLIKDLYELEIIPQYYRILSSSEERLNMITGKKIITDYDFEKTEQEYTDKQYALIYKVYNQFCKQ